MVLVWFVLMPLVRVAEEEVRPGSLLEAMVWTRQLLNESVLPILLPVLFVLMAFTHWTNPNGADTLCDFLARLH
jgi:hypothetical protein